jgi:penicillin-binding protein 2
VNDRSRQRLFVLRALVVGALFALLGRLWFLQVVSGGTYATAAVSNTTRNVVDPATRGYILDDEGNRLVDNVSAYVVTVDRTVLAQQRDKGVGELTRLAKLLSMSGKPPVTAASLQTAIRLCDYKKYKPPSCWKGSPYQPVPVAVFNTQVANPNEVFSRIARIKDHADEFPGVAAPLEAVRNFPDSINGVVPHTKLAAQALGYTAPITTDDTKKGGVYASLPPDAQIGRDGLEYYYDRKLRGVNGARTVQVNAAGDVVGTLSTTAPQNGDHLVLNLDVNVQRAAERAIKNALTQYAPAAMTVDPKGNPHPTTGAAVVLTTDGRIVALANAPSYDPTLFLNGISQQQLDTFTRAGQDSPLLNRAATQNLSPGSSWKIVSAATALEYGLATIGGTQPCSPTLTVGDQIFRNFDGESAGNITIPQALEISCDVIFDKFAFDEWFHDGRLKANKDAREAFAKTARQFGFGSSTGIDLPAESAGLVRDRASLRRFWQETKDGSCKRYPHESGDAQRYDHENCVDGYLYQGGAATQFGIGQGPYLDVTPLQLARAYVAVANGGTLYAPTLAKAFLRPDGTVDQTIIPKPVGRLPVSASALNYIKQGLEMVTHGDRGTAAGIFKDYKVNVAGKTGTAEVTPLDPKTGNPLPPVETSWFASYAPADNPQYVVLVAVPKSNQGALVAAPAVKDIYDAIFSVKNNKIVPHKGAFNGASTRPKLLPCFDATGHITAPKFGCSPSETTAPQPPKEPAPTTVTQAPSSGATALGALLDSPMTPPDRRSVSARRGGVR